MKKFSEFSKGGYKSPKKIFEADISQFSVYQNTQDNSSQDATGVQTNQQQTDSQTQNVDTQNKQEVENKTEGDKKVNLTPLFSKLFESREMAHVYHLQVKGDMGSHAKHTALQEYYESIIGELDDLIEIYQAQFDIVEGYDVIDTKSTKSKDPLEYFTELATFVKEQRSSIDDYYSEFHNIIDDILVIIFKTIYKLKYTK